METLPAAEQTPAKREARQADTPVKSLDANPLDRSMDRLLAAMGVLYDAVPVFAPTQNLPRAGVLLAIPALVASGLLSMAEKIYGSLGPAFYGLRTTLVAYVLLALLRIPRPEMLKEYSPGELGRLVGLDRMPEVKTLRRKLARLAALKGSYRLGREIARQRITERFTTVQAESALWQAGLTHKQRKARRDRVAAQILLQAYLEAGCPNEPHPKPLDH